MNKSFDIHISNESLEETITTEGLQMLLTTSQSLLTKQMDRTYLSTLTTLAIAALILLYTTRDPNYELVGILTIICLVVITYNVYVYKKIKTIWESARTDSAMYVRIYLDIASSILNTNSEIGTPLLSYINATYNTDKTSLEALKNDIDND